MGSDGYGGYQHGGESDPRIVWLKDSNGDRISPIRPQFTEPTYHALSPRYGHLAPHPPPPLPLPHLPHPSQPPLIFPKISIYNENARPDKDHLQIPPTNHHVQSRNHGRRHSYDRLSSAIPSSTTSDFETSYDPPVRPMLQRRRSSFSSGDRLIEDNHRRARNDHGQSKLIHEETRTKTYLEPPNDRRRSPSRERLNPTYHHASSSRNRHSPDIDTYRSPRRHQDQFINYLERKASHRHRSTDSTYFSDDSSSEYSYLPRSRTRDRDLPRKGILRNNDREPVYDYHERRSSRRNSEDPGYFSEEHSRSRPGRSRSRYRYEY